MGRPKLVEGWATLKDPGNGQRQHYFRDGKSLCGSHEQGDLSLTSKLKKRPELCMTCMKKSNASGEGWAYAKGSPDDITMQHYFRDGRSLCGSCSEADTLTAFTDKPGPHKEYGEAYCGTCSDILDGKAQPAQANEADPEAAVAEGWAVDEDDVDAECCYFRDGKSLCGQFLLGEDVVLHAELPGDRKICPACQKVRVYEKYGEPEDAEASPQPETDTPQDKTHGPEPEPEAEPKDEQLDDDDHEANEADDETNEADGEEADAPTAEAEPEAEPEEDLANITEYERLLNEARDLAEMTATKAWRRFYNSLRRDISRHSEAVLVAEKSRDVVYHQAAVRVIRDLQDRAREAVDALNGYAHSAPLFAGQMTCRVRWNPDLGMVEITERGPEPTTLEQAAARKDGN